MGGHIRAGQRRMPVVRVHQIGRPASVEFAAGQMRRHPSEQPEPLQVVAPIGAAGVKIRVALAPVQLGCIDDIGRHAAPTHHTQAQADARHTKHRTDLAHRLLLLDTLHDRRQTGQYQTHICALRHQRLGQGTHHICQAPGLDERKHFRSGMQHTKAPGRPQALCKRLAEPVRTSARSHHAAVILSSMSRVTRQMPLALR